MEKEKEKNSAFIQNKMPHNGELLKKHVLQSASTQKQIAAQMGVALPTLMSYYKREKLYTEVLWKASLELRYNFLTDLGMKIPVELPSERETALRKQLEEVRRENEHLKIEIGVYEKILKKE